MKCGHSFTKTVKGEEFVQCKKCKKQIHIGRETPSRAFGKPVWQRN